MSAQPGNRNRTWRLILHYPQLVEVNTPQRKDADEGHPLYDGFMVGEGAIDEARRPFVALGIKQRYRQIDGLF